MSTQPITITADVPFLDALRLMHEHQFRRLPIVDAGNKLIGIVSERDLLHASPSSATTLSIWELNYLLSKVQVAELMTSDVITTTPDECIENAAQLMAEHRIGGLPVVDAHNHVVGVITETDIFKTFVQMYRGGQSGLRLTLQVPDRKGVLLELSRAIFDLDGEIVSVASSFNHESSDYTFVVKVRGVGKEQLVNSLEALGEHVIDAHEV